MMVEMVVVIRQGTSPQYQNRYLDLVQTNHLQIVRRQCCLVVIMILVEMMKLLLITCVRTLSSHCRGPFKWSSEVEHCETKWQCSVAIGNIAIGDKRSQEVTRGHLSSRESRWPSVYGTRHPTPGCASAWGGGPRWLPSRFGRRRRWRWRWW